MKKRILSLLVFTVMMFNVLSYAAELPADVYDTEFENDVKILSSLGIVEVGEEGLFMPYSNITRAELAVMLKNLIRPESVSMGSGYYDVADTHYASDAINYLTEQGYMSGYGDGMFMPDEKIRFYEMVKVAVSMLGYDRLADAEGGYPAGYLKIAQDIGILDDVSSDGEYINKGNISKVLVNLFDINPVKLEFDGNNPVFITDENVTMINVLCGIYKEKGIVSANENYSLMGNKAASEGRIVINSKEFIYNDGEDFVGCNVDCYYSINDDDEFVVEAIIPTDRKNGIVKISAVDIESYENYLIEFSDGDTKLKKVKYDNNTVFVYNGKSMELFKAEDLDFENGYIEWIDNDSDNVAECIRIFEYYNMVVEFASEEKIVDKFDNAKLIEYEKYESIFVCDKFGNKMNITDIKPGMVASVYKSNSSNDNIIKIVLSEELVEGTVKSVNERDGIRYVVIDDTEYVVYSGYKTYQGTGIALRDSGTYLMDADGKIVTFLKGAKGDFSIGMLVRCKSYDDETTGEKIIDFRIFTQGGSLADIKAEEKLRLDNEVYKSEAFVEAETVLKSVEGEPVRYKLNGDGILTVIDTTKDGTGGINDKLSKGQKITNGVRYLSDTKILEGQMVLDPELITFIVPSDFEKAVESDFACSGIGYFVGNSTYNGISSYYLEDKIPADIVVLQASTSVINHKSSVALVQSVGTCLNADEEEVDVLEVYVGGKTEKWLTESKNTLDKVYKINKYSRAGDTLEVVASQKIERGDLIKCAFNSHGAINKVALVYDENKGSMVSVNPYHTDFHAQGQRYVQGKVNNKYENYAEIVYKNSSGNELKEYHNIGKGNIFRINTKNKNIMEAVSMAEITDALHNLKPENVIIISETGVPRVTYIYE